MKWETIWPNTAKDVVSSVSGLNSLNPEDKMKLTRHNFPGQVSLSLMHYNARRLIGSRIIESAAYCNQKLLEHLYLNRTQNTSVNWIIRLLLSLLCWPKVILLSGGHCIVCVRGRGKGLGAMGPLPRPAWNSVFLDFWEIVVFRCFGVKYLSLLPGPLGKFCPRPLENFLRTPSFSKMPIMLKKPYY
jgi:hypothetical protein